MSQKNIVEAVKEKNLKIYGLSNIHYNKHGKKTGVDTELGWTKKTTKELYNIFDKKNNYNWIFVIPDEKLFIYDTDEELSYDIAVKSFKEQGIYNKKAITTSFSGKHQNLPYKKHFWFKIKDEDILKFKESFGKKVNDFDDNEKRLGLDLFFNSNGNVGENPETKIDLDNLPILSYEQHLKTMKAMNLSNTIKKNIEKPKKEQKEKKPKKIGKKEEQLTHSNSNISYDDLITLLESIKKSRWENFEDWLHIYWIFINEKLDISLFHKYSKQSEKYDAEKNERILSSSKRCNGYTLATLYFWLKEDNQEVYRQLQSTRKDFFNFVKQFNNEDCANMYYISNPHQYVRGEMNGWYQYNANNVLTNTGKEHPKSLLNNVSSFFKNLIDEQQKYTSLADEKRHAILLKAYKTAGSSSFARGCIDYLSSLYTVEKIEEKIDNQNNLLAFNDYLYDIKLKKFRKIEPTDYISVTTGYDAPVYINKKGDICPKKSDVDMKIVKDLIHSIFENEEMEEYYKTITSLSLFTTKMQKLYIHTGSGGNGKGILSTLLRHALGDYYLTGENTFLTTVYKSGSPNETLTKSKGTRYLSISEPDNGEQKCRFNVDLIKIITGGDVVTTRAMYGKNISFTPQFSLNVQCNQKPELGKMDKGIVRRFVVIPYKFNFVDNPKKNNERKRDYSLVDKIAKTEVKEQFILMLLDYAQKIYESDYSNIKMPKSVSDETAEYINENNLILDWMEKRLIITNNPKDKIKTTDALKDYNEDVDTEVPITAKDMVKHMAYNGIEICRSNGSRQYVGCRLKDKIVDDDQ
jgi:P4 family phage/plasmid primase-like protien